MFAQTFVGSPLGKLCNSLERNIRRKVGLTSEKRFRREIILFFATVLSGMSVGYINTKVMQGFVGITVKYVVKYSD